MGVDTERIAYFLQFQFLIVNGIIRIAVFSVFLGRLLGWIPLIAGLSAWLMLLPGSVWFSNRLLANSKTLMHLRDGKLAKIYEAISGIRQIKFSALETQWEERILAHRYKELQSIRKYFVADSALFGCMILGQIILAAASLTVYVFINDGLAPSVAFVSISMFNTLESTLGSLPELITLGLDTLVSLRRIEAHLLGPEIQNNLTPAPTISFQGATVSWPTESEASDEARFCLRDLSLSFPVGCLSVISGKAGSGKSLLLSAILGEADLLEGSISVPPALQTSCPSTARMENWTQSGSVAYVAQNPWLTNGSLRNNILFGLPFNQQRYDQVVEATSLRHDFSVLTDGDATEIGENGVNLSGGQKWRVTLARAIYSRAEILILDDIFCAVDATVGRSILDKCLNGTLCKGRTRILVTHNVDLVLPITDYIVELGGGKVTYRGRPQYRSSQPTASQNEGHDVSTTSNSSPVPGDTKEDALMNTGTDADDNPPAELMSPPHIPRIYVHEEQRASGTVKKQVYLAYLGSSGGMRLWCTCIIVFLTYQFCILGELFIPAFFRAPTNK